MLCVGDCYIRIFSSIRPVDIIAMFLISRIDICIVLLSTVDLFYESTSYINCMMNE